MEEKNQKKGKGCLKAVLFGALGFLVLIIVLVAVSDKDEQPDNVQATTSVTVEETDKCPWKSRFYVDEMTGDTTFCKSVESENTVYFSFPYDGGSTFELEVRAQPGEKAEILLSTDKGQFMPSFSSEYLRVRFDDKAPFNVSYNGASSGKATVIFLESVPRLIKELKQAKTVKIEAPFFEDGRRVIEFQVQGFEWDI